MLVIKKLGFLGLGLCILAFAPTPATAISGEMGFGGMQTMVFDSDICDCSGTNVHFIKTSTGILKLYYGGGKLYDSGNISSIGKYQLGTYSPGGPPCMKQVAQACVQVTTVDGIYGSGPGTGISFKQNRSAEVFSNFISSFLRTNG